MTLNVGLARRRRIRSVGTCVTLALGLVGSPVFAQVFPPDGDWQALTRNGVPLGDPAGDQAKGYLDVVGDAANPAAYIYRDATFLYFRLRVNESALIVGQWSYGEWGCEIDTNGNLNAYERMSLFGANAINVRVHWYENTTSPQTGTPNDPPEILRAVYPVPPHASMTSAASNFGGTPDYFVNWAMPISALTMANITGQTPMRLICGTSDLQGVINGDLITTSGQTNLTGLAADAFYLDCAEPCTVGLGQCQNTGTYVCSNGTIACSVMPHPPMAEVCDNIDNDCDGIIDDGPQGENQNCGTNIGACQSGITACQNGSMMCVGSIMPMTEVCDNVDNDCNGNIDDGIPAGGACINGMYPGVCAQGTLQCSTGQTICVATILPGTMTEVCDGLDNDCDGMTDEGNLGGGQACMTALPGICGPGTMQCANGKIQCIANIGPGSVMDTCNGIDDDCDAMTDEGYDVGSMCTVGLGQCAAQGMIGCNAQGGSECSALPSPPSSELCDGLDNDCDGQADNGFDVGMACSVGMGQCAAQGTKVCADANGTICNVMPGQPSLEVCDGVDNDCNGQTDEGCGDGDGDGLNDNQEADLGTNPNDADSDDDGVLDNAEIDPAADSDADGTINALEPDSDNDQLFDGTELGLDCSHPDTDSTQGHCLADADKGATVTDPLVSDTDAGGIADGAEDINHDGAIDTNETDPNFAADDQPGWCATDSDCDSNMLCQSNQCQPRPVCVPGQQIECACPSGGSGAQVCLADGSGFEACQCSAPIPSTNVDDGGCGCAVIGDETSPSRLGWGILAFLGAWWRRRRTRNDRA